MTKSSNKPHACKQVCSSLNRDVVIYSLVLIQVYVVLCCCFCFHFAVYVLGVCLVASPFLYQYLAVLKKYNIRDFWVCSNCITWFLKCFCFSFTSIISMTGYCEMWYHYLEHPFFKRGASSWILCAVQIGTVKKTFSLCYCCFYLKRWDCLLLLY
jgi:hypothetical protein